MYRDAKKAEDENEEKPENQEEEKNPFEDSNLEFLDEVMEFIRIERKNSKMKWKT